MKIIITDKQLKILSEQAVLKKAIMACLIAGGVMVGNSCTKEKMTENPFISIQDGIYELDFKQDTDSMKYIFEIVNQNITLKRYKNDIYTGKYYFTRKQLSSGIVVMDKTTQKYDVLLMGELMPDNETIEFNYNIGNKLYTVYTKKIK